jgi:WD40 repeat protein
VTFSPDGRHIASGSFDNTICVWDANKVHSVELQSHICANDLVGFTSYLDSALNGMFVFITLIFVYSYESLDQSSYDAFSQNHKILVCLSLAFKNTGIDHDWAVGPNKELLLYIPAQHQIALYSPRNSLVIGQGVTMLDSSDVVGGKSWKLCHEQYKIL